MKNVYLFHFPLLFILTATLLFGCSKDKPKDSSEDDTGVKVETYDQLVLKDKPVGFWLLNFNDTKDATSYKHHGQFGGASTQLTSLPNKDKANIFNGSDSYFEIPDSDHLEISKTGILTIETWFCPEVLDFPKVESGKDYIHWMGKGESNQHSWVARMYNKDSWRENRPNRISGYAFNLEGGLGAGSYFQDTDIIPNKTWIHFVLIINTKNTSSKYPTGYTKVYRDGKLRDQDDLQSYNIIPKNGSAPIRIGTRDKNSFFKGSIAKVALYDYELSQEKIDSHFKKMMKKD